jgi:hypothetical protein
MKPSAACAANAIGNICNPNSLVGFQVLTAVSMKCAVLFPNSMWLGKSPPVSAVFFDLEDEGDIFLRNVGFFLN